VFLGLTYIFVGLRVYVKTVLSKGWGADDWLLVAAQVGRVLSSGLSSLSCFSSCLKFQL